MRFLGDIPELDCDDQVLHGLVAVCQEIQQSVSEHSVKFLAALVNVDWFSEWPAEALQSVAMRFLGDIPELDCDDQVLHGLVAVCQEIQQSVSEHSVKFLAEMSRCDASYSVRHFCTVCCFVGSPGVIFNTGVVFSCCSS